MIRPKWEARDTGNKKIKWKAFVPLKHENNKVFEVFMIRDDGQDPMEIRACWSATVSINALFLPMNAYPKTSTYNYTEKQGKARVGIGITIPSKDRAKKVLQSGNVFELFTEILMLNGFSFYRPEMEVLDYAKLMK